MADWKKIPKIDAHIHLLPQDVIDANKVYNDRFIDFGDYNKGDGQALHNAIGEAIDGKLPNSVEQTKFGQKYTFNTKIRGKDGSYKSANVVVVVQNDNGKVTWRTITLYPGKKD